MADNFTNLIRDWWNISPFQGCGAFILAKKITSFRARLKHWAKFEFGSIKLKKLALLHDLEKLEVEHESRSLSEDECYLEASKRVEYGRILKQEEVYWKQRARVTWLKEGDENTKFFHAVANGRRNRNFIPWIGSGDTRVADFRGIGDMFTSFYKNLFGSTQGHRHQINWNILFLSKVHPNLSSLDVPFTHAEIKAAVFSMSVDKAPRPDGFPMFFFQKFWDVVQEDIFTLCEDFYWGRANLERINWANIALILKKLNPDDPSHYRLISLINSSLKIISKLLANRLSLVIKDLIDSSQSAFIKGRCIVDNIATANKLIFFIQKHRLAGLIFKVDFAKAFDTVDWDFLFELLEARGFGERWVGWIKSILVSSKAKFLINGKECGYVRYHRGLRQGDLLSPLFFVLVVDVLSTLFNNALNSGVLHGVMLGDSGIKMCHLQYADDLLIMMTGGGEDLRIIKLILYFFEGLSGLQVNSEKSCLFSSSRNSVPLPYLARTLHCCTSSLPLTYLGIPISGNRPRRQDWDTLISKISSRLAVWKSKFLSLGGRLTLLNSVLSAIPTYWMLIFKLPCWVIKRIDKIRRDFLWSGPDPQQPKIRLVSWTRLCRSKDQGGWGFLNLNTFNMWRQMVVEDFV